MVWPPSLALRRGMWHSRQSLSAEGCDVAKLPATRQASGTVVGNGLHQRFVRIVAGGTPQPAAAVLRAGTHRKLLHMTDHFENARGHTLRHDISIDRVGIF